MVLGVLLLHLFNHRLRRLTQIFFSHRGPAQTMAGKLRDHREKIKEIEPQIHPSQ
jgi:hypothetical protein